MGVARHLHMHRLSMSPIRLCVKLATAKEDVSESSNCLQVVLMSMLDTSNSEWRLDEESGRAACCTRALDATCTCTLKHFIVLSCLRGQFRQTIICEHLGMFYRCCHGRLAGPILPQSTSLFTGISGRSSRMARPIREVGNEPCVL